MSINPEKHFVYDSWGYLFNFNRFFLEGVTAAYDGKEIDICPYGLPDEPKWTQDTLLMSEGLKRSGWLLGWWAGRLYQSLDYDRNEAENYITGAGTMAAMLWTGACPSEKSCYVTEEEIAEALGCTVEAVGARAQKEGWPYVFIPSDPQRPILEVYNNPDPAPKTTLEDRFRAVREYLNKTQAQMDSLLGIGKKSWQRYETGRSGFGYRVIKALVKKGFDANWILTGQGSMLLTDGMGIAR